MSDKALETELPAAQPSAAVLQVERAETRKRWGIRIGQVLIGLAILGIWQFASGRLIDDFFISSPIAVAVKLWIWTRNGTLANAFAYTMQAMVLGFIIGSVSGFIIGFLLGRSDTAAKLFDPYITAIYCLPKIALAPLLIMWFGIGLESKVAMAALIVFFLVFLNTFAGVRDVSAIHINAARIMGANGWQLLRYVIFPSAAAWVLTGLKVSVPYALIGAVVGELISSNRGIGFLIGQASGMFDTAGVFAGLVVLAVTGMVLNSALKALETHLLRWRELK
ncbi:ABC transporter permease [Ferrovibrio terrae]|jgi:NitT/TauT family transport system permease protein|uniref:ABC transporter permease n=1 Tax=Ferrovibrio terrae TaxID=2594003 RepID=UPI00313775CF